MMKLILHSQSLGKKSYSLKRQRWYFWKNLMIFVGNLAQQSEFFYIMRQNNSYNMI